MEQGKDALANNITEGNNIGNPTAITIDASNIPNAVLKRLIEEVRLESRNSINAYNRTHNRHNRGR